MAQNQILQVDSPIAHAKQMTHLLVSQSTMVMANLGNHQGIVPDHIVWSIKKWDNEYYAATSRIKQLSNVGGNELRELAKNEVKHLKELSHELFCGVF